MQNPTAKRIIIDTNVLISFLIGKRIKKLRTVIANSDFLITGDNDLLELKMYHKTKIVSAAEFELLLHS